MNTTTRLITLNDQQYIDYTIHLKLSKHCEKLEREHEIMVKALKSIKMENLDGKTQTRFIEALKDYMSRVSKISWNALKEIGIDPLSR